MKVNEFEEAGWNAVGTGFSRAKPPKVHKLDLGDSEAVNSFIDKTK